MLPLRAASLWKRHAVHHCLLIRGGGDRWILGVPKLMSFKARLLLKAIEFYIFRVSHIRGALHIWSFTSFGGSVIWCCTSMEFCIVEVSHLWRFTSLEFYICEVLHVWVLRTWSFPFQIWRFFIPGALHMWSPTYLECSHIWSTTYSEFYIFVLLHTLSLTYLGPYLFVVATYLEFHTCGVLHTWSFRDSDATFTGHAHRSYYEMQSVHAAWPGSAQRYMPGSL